MRNNQAWSIAAVPPTLCQVHAASLECCFLPERLFLGMGGVLVAMRRGFAVSHHWDGLGRFSFLCWHARAFG